MQMNVFYEKKETIQMKFLEICKAEIDLVREIKGMKLESEIRNKMYWFDSNKGKIREFRWVIINNKITWINEYLSVIYLVDKKEGKHESFHNENDIIADEYRYLGGDFYMKCLHWMCKCETILLNACENWLVSSNI